MENVNNKNKIDSESQTEEMDTDFLNELNNLSKQLKTDEEIMKDCKPEQPEKQDNNTSRDNNSSESNIINNINNNIYVFNNINLNENLFIEDFNNLKQNNFFGDFETQSLQSLNSINATISRLNSFLYQAQKKDNKNVNDVSDKENKILSEILDFLLESDLLKSTISNMKKEIKNSFENCKNKLKKGEIEKYEEALQNADAILDEIDKKKPNKDKIMDCMSKFQEISNSIDSMINVK